MAIARISKEAINKCLQEAKQSGLTNYQISDYKTWCWQYVENPFCLGKNPAAWLYTLNGGKAVGHIGAIPVELKMGSEKIIAGWAVDLITLSKYRRRGIGASLVIEANKHFDIFLAIGTSKMSFPLFIKTGWEYLGNIPYYIKIWDAKILMRKKIRSIFVANLICIPANLFLKILNFLKRPRIPEGIKIKRMDTFSEEADLFWKKISTHYKIIVPRDKAYLSWKYDRQPDMHYVKLRAKRGDILCGYALLRCIETESAKPEGLITDVITDPRDKEAIEALLFMALEYLKNQGCNVVRCYATSKNIQRALKNYGFIRRNSQMRFVISKNTDGLGEVENLDNWHITAGDSDIDRYL